MVSSALPFSVLQAAAMAASPFTIKKAKVEDKEITKWVWADKGVPTFTAAGLKSKEIHEFVMYLESAAMHSAYTLTAEFHRGVVSAALPLDNVTDRGTRCGLGDFMKTCSRATTKICAARHPEQVHDMGEENMEWAMHWPPALHEPHGLTNLDKNGVNLVRDLTVKHEMACQRELALWCRLRRTEALLAMHEQEVREEIEQFRLECESAEAQERIDEQMQLLASELSEAHGYSQ